MSNKSAGSPSETSSSELRGSSSCKNKTFRIVHISVHRYRKVMGLNPVQARIFSGCFFNCLSCKHTARITNFTHVYPQFTYLIFIYSYSYIFTIIGYMTNSQLTIYPCGLVAQWMEHCTRIAMSWVSNTVQARIFFRLLFSLLKLKAHCEDHKFYLNYAKYKVKIKQNM